MRMRPGDASLSIQTKGKIMRQFNSRGSHQGRGPARSQPKMAFTGGTMTKALTVLLAAGALFFAWRTFGPSSALAWNHDINDAQQQAAQTKKPILMFFTVDWCPPCQQFKKDTLTDEQVELALQNDWVLMKVDLTARGGEPAMLARSLGVSSIPTLMVFHPDGTQLDSRRGYAPPAVLLSWLNACKARIR